MRKFSSMIFAAVLGSVLTIGAVKLVWKDEGKTIKIEHVDVTPAKGVAYTVDEDGIVAPVSFTEAAEKVMAGVVHIKSTQTRASVRRGSPDDQYQDPFRDFFGDDFFERFFGPRFQQPDQRGPQPIIGSGSGVIINSSGYIVTNNHVINNADDIEVTLHDNRTFKATVIGADPSTDIALLQIKTKDLPSIPLSNSDNVKVGEWVLAVGNPFNLNSTVTAGIVSAKGRSINILQADYPIESFIQTDAAINPGNSGGALVNLQGGLIGINTAIASPTGAYSGYGFAVPSNIVNKVVEDLLKYGTVQRGVLGIGIRSITSDLTREKDLGDLDVYEGVYVDSVYEKSAAENAGVKVGDVILGVDGNNVRNTAELIGIIGRHRPGDKVTLKINRKGSIKDVDVTLKNLQGDSQLAVKETTGALGMLGADFETIDKDLARKLDIDGGVQVKKLYPGKLRQSTDMREGFIVTKADGKAVKSVDDLNKALEGKKGGVMIEGVYPDYPGVYYYAFGL